MQYEEATEQWLREAIKRQTMEAVEEDPEEHPVAWSVIDPFERVELLIPTWRDALSSEAWRGVREPLAPLIAHTDFAALDRHYRELDWFLAQLHGMSNDDPKTRFSYLSSLAETKGKLEVQMRKLLENVLPNYTEPHWFKQRFGL
jgi:hypothetical protein